MGQLNEQVVSARTFYVCVLQATSSCARIGNNAWEWSYGKHDEQEFTGLNIVLDGNYIRRNFLDCNNPGCDLAKLSSFNHLAKLSSLAKWLSVRFRTKRFWVRVQLQSLNNYCFFFHFNLHVTSY